MGAPCCCRPHPMHTRARSNPAYYHLEDASAESTNDYLSDLVDGVMTDLENAGCIEVAPQGDALRPAVLGRVASYYYLKYTSVALFHAELHDVEEGP